MEKTTDTSCFPETQDAEAAGQRPQHAEAAAAADQRPQHAEAAAAAAEAASHRPQEVDAPGSQSPLPPITSYTDSELSEYHTLLTQTRTHYERIVQDTATFEKCSPTEQFAIHLCLRETTNDLEEVVAEMKTRRIG